MVRPILFVSLYLVQYVMYLIKYIIYLYPSKEGMISDCLNFCKSENICCVIFTFISYNSR